MNDPCTLDDARTLLRDGRWLALTGAGMSVDSGVPPFRGPGGLWETFDPELYAHVRTLEDAPERSWELFRLLGRAIADARPHEGHRALARAEASGRVLAVVTQNIDGLHQAAGARDVIELHGSVREHRCHACGRPAAIADVLAATAVPRCACGGVLRPAITMFGEMLPDGAMERATALLFEAGRLLVVGTSSEVYPAALLPLTALQERMPVLVVGPDPSRLTSMAGVTWLRGRAQDLLPSLFEAAA